MFISFFRRSGRGTKPDIIAQSIQVGFRSSTRPTEEYDIINLKWYDILWIAPIAFVAAVIF